MKRLNRLLCIFFLFVLCTCAGCTQTADDITDSIDDTVIAVPDELQTITFCFWAYGETGQPRNLKSINEMLDELNKRTEQDLNTKIRFEWLPYDIDSLENGEESTYKVMLQEALGSEDGPDAFIISGDLDRQLYNEGLLMDITELFPTFAPGYYMTLNDRWGSELEYFYKIDDRIYTIPNNQFYSGRYAVVARKDLVDKYTDGGIDDLDDYCAFLKAVNENEEHVFPGEMQPYNFIDAYVKGHGYFNLGSYVLSRWDGNDIDPVFMHDIAEFHTACRLYKDLLDNGITLDNKFNISEALGKGLLASRLDRVYSMYRYGDFASDYEYRIYPIYQESLEIESPPSIYSLGIGIKSVNADRVLMFIEWLHSKQENYELLMYGIEGKHFEFSGDHMDFTGYGRDAKEIRNWSGSEAFGDYILERRYSFEPDNYLKLRMNFAKLNTVSHIDLYRGKGYDITKYLTSTEDEINEHMSVFKSILPSITEISDEYQDYFQLLGMGVYKPFDQVIEEEGLQSKIDAVLDYHKSMLDEYKE